jgi:CheY-like chemotaxis protein
MLRSNEKSPNGTGQNLDLHDKDAMLREAAVLIVEPSAPARKTIVDRLAAAGFAAMRVASDEQSAADACAAAAPDVILVQAALGDGDPGFVDRLRAAGDGHAPSVIFLSDGLAAESASRCWPSRTTASPCRATRRKCRGASPCMPCCASSSGPSIPSGRRWKTSSRSGRTA